MTKPITAIDLAKREGSSTVKERIQKLASTFGRTYKPDVIDTNNPVKARINQGRWIADCECGGAEYVDPDEPIFFCLSCGNKASGGRPREVIFPVNREEIEKEVMSRKVRYLTGKDRIEKELRAIPVGLPRSWRPEE